MGKYATYTREERIAKAIEIQGYRDKGMKVGVACKKAKVSPYNYANWKGLVAKQPAAGATTRDIPLSKTPLNTVTATALPMRGTTDLMFIGFGRSRDVLAAIDNLSGIFRGKLSEVDV